MRTKLGWLVGAALAALAGFAVAQVSNIVPTGLSGNEAWLCAVGGPQGPSTFCTTSLMRNTTGYAVLGSASGTVTPAVNVNDLLVNAQPAASTAFVTPVSPVFDGQLFNLCNVTASAWSTNASSLAASAGQSINGGSITTTTLAAGSCVELQYQLSSTTWFRIR